MIEWSPPPAFDGYRVIRLLGQGGMGQVHLAHDDVLDRDVAIKFLSRADADEAERKRFLTEARAIARLQHPNVVAVHRVGEIDGCPYLVSEFVRGASLDRLPTPLPYERVLYIAVGLARGLAAAHKRGVVHRDIKPANAIVDDDGEVKLLDFGIAKLMHAESLLGEGGLSTPPAAPAPAPETLDSAALAELEPPPASVRIATTSDAPSPSNVERFSTAATLSISLSDLGAAFPLLDLASTATSRKALGKASASMTATLPSVRAFLTLEEAEASPASARPAVDATPGNGVASGLTPPGAALGTPLYMAPEIWAGEAATYRTDIYSLGALLYTLCTGHPPHQATEISTLARDALFVDAKPLTELVPDLDPAFSAIVARCLARDPVERFAAGNEVRAALAQLTPELRSAVRPTGNPYRGLHAFEAEHRAYYFGRDSEVRMILERLAADPFVLVAGDSGVGKSSLCRAGVMPRIQDWLDKKRQWSDAIVAPGRQPLLALASALAPYVERTEGETLEAMRTDPGGLVRELRSHLGTGRGLVVFVDQCEELLTIGAPEELEAASQMLGWLSVNSSAVRLLATVRGDFLSRIAVLSRVGEEVARALYFLRPLTEDRMREVIVGPAAALGVTFETDELVEELISSAVQAEGGLPLLQFALAELWNAKGPGANLITAQHLAAIGGVGGALSRHADDVIARMLPKEREAAKRLLLRLVTSSGTRAQRTATELGAEDSSTRSALDALVAGRLLVARDAPEGAAFQIAHEALLSGWTTLANWLTADADSRAVRERLRIAVTEWERLGRAPDTLWSARQLAESATLLGEGVPERERAFLDASHRAERRRRALRFGLAASALVGAGLIYGMSVYKARADVTARVDAKLSQAAEEVAAAHAIETELARVRGAAFTLFDKQDRLGGEAMWRKVLSLTSELPPHLVRAGQLLETAVLLDQTRVDVRARLGDLLVERATIAEARGHAEERDELLQRLALYDDDGSRRRAWEAPGHLQLEVGSFDAVIELERYAADERGRLRPEPFAELNGSSVDTDLRAGSYRAHIHTPGHAPARLPFVLRRGERLHLTVAPPTQDVLRHGYAYVPEGPFLFGSGEEDRLRQDFFHAVPLHEVRTAAYLIGEHETTFAEWIEFLSALPPDERKAHQPRIGRGGFQGALALNELAGGGFELAFQPMSQPYRAQAGEPIVYPGRQKRASQDWRRFPVVGISLEDARAFTAWLDRSGRLPNARLCTDQEWEKGARGADGREFPHGATLEPEDANYDETYGREPLAMGPDEVASHPASVSPFGLHDMAGNVWEWARSSVAPNEFTARGGSWYFGLNSARTTDRELTEPTFRDGSVGMRVCADISAR